MSDLYRNSHLGEALEEACAEMVDQQYFGEELKEKIMLRFDKVR